MSNRKWRQSQKKNVLKMKVTLRKEKKRHRCASVIGWHHHNHYIGHVCSTDFHRFTSAVLCFCRHILNTILTKLPLHMFCFCFFIVRFHFFPFCSSQWLFFFFIHFLGVLMMDFFLSHSMYHTRKMRFFMDMKIHARDMPRDGRAIDYYVIQSNAALFISWLSWFFFSNFIFYYITKSLLVFPWWFTLSYCGWMGFRFTIYSVLRLLCKMAHNVVDMSLSDFLSLIFCHLPNP